MSKGGLISPESSINASIKSQGRDRFRSSDFGVASNATQDVFDTIHENSHYGQEILPDNYPIDDIIEQQSRQSTDQTKYNGLQGGHNRTLTVECEPPVQSIAHRQSQQQSDGLPNEASIQNLEDMIKTQLQNINQLLNGSGHSKERSPHIASDIPCNERENCHQDKIQQSQIEYKDQSKDQNVYGQYSQQELDGINGSPLPKVWDTRQSNQQGININQVDQPSDQQDLNMSHQLYQDLVPPGSFFSKFAPGTNQTPVQNIAQLVETPGNQLDESYCIQSQDLYRDVTSPDSNFSPKSPQQFSDSHTWAQNLIPLDSAIDNQSPNYHILINHNQNNAKNSIETEDRGADDSNHSTPQPKRGPYISLDSQTESTSQYRPTYRAQYFGGFDQDCDRHSSEAGNGTITNSVGSMPSPQREVTLGANITDQANTQLHLTQNSYENCSFDQDGYLDANGSTHDNREQQQLQVQNISRAGISRSGVKNRARSNHEDVDSYMDLIDKQYRRDYFEDTNLTSQQYQDQNQASGLQRPKSQGFNSSDISAPYRSSTRPTTPKSRVNTQFQEFNLSFKRNQKNRHSRQEVLKRVKSSQNLPTQTLQQKTSQKFLSNYPISRKFRLKQLAQPKAHGQSRQKHLKSVGDDESLEECSFAPQTGRGPVKSLSRPPLPVADRLYHAYDDIIDQRNKKKVEKENIELMNCTFQPKINRSSTGNAPYVPIQERVDKILKDKNERLANCRLVLEVYHPDCTFNPKLNEKSRAMAENKYQSHNTGFDRLHEAKQITYYGRVKQEAKQLQQEESLFRPQLNPNSDEILARNQEIPLDFYDRQQYYQQINQEKIEQLRQSQEDSNCRFQPDTGTTDKVLPYTRYKPIILENSADRVERLSTQDQQSKEAKFKALEQQYYKQFTFKPKINPRSQRIAKASTIDDLVSARSIQESREQAMLRAEEEFRSECTFRPSISGSQSSSYCSHKDKFTISSQQGQGDLISRIAQYQQYKNQKVTQQKHLREYKELMNCTFNPEINKGYQYRKQQQKSVVVKGLGRYLETKLLAQRKHYEQKQRESKVFQYNLQETRMHPTVPEPFELSGTQPERSMARSDKLREQMRKKVFKECTFRPVTNETVKKWQIKQILDGSVATQDECTNSGA